VSLVKKFNVDQTASLKEVKICLEKQNKKYSMKEVKQMLESTKRNLVETVKLKEQLIAKQ